MWPVAITSIPSAGWNFIAVTDDRHITARISLRSSFSVRYRWPLACRLQLLISPIKWMVLGNWSVTTRLIIALRWETVTVCGKREAGGGVAMRLRSKVGRLAAI